jgi:hypothetical protein
MASIVLYHKGFKINVTNRNLLIESTAELAISFGRCRELIETSATHARWAVHLKVTSSPT